jgi:hypothetical protein
MQKIYVIKNTNSSINHGLDEEHAKQLDHRKQKKWQWLQNPSYKNVDNVENIRHKSNKHVTNKNQDYLNNKSNEV